MRELLNIRDQRTKTFCSVTGAASIGVFVLEKDSVPGAKVEK